VDFSIGFMMDTSGLHLPLCFDKLTYVRDRGIPLLPRVKSLAIDMGDMTDNIVDVRKAVGTALHRMIVSRRNLSSAEVQKVAELEAFSFESWRLAYLQLEDVDGLLALAYMEPWTDDDFEYFEDSD
jgi:hypothetical protein